MECGTSDYEVVPRRALPTGAATPWSICVGIAGQFGVESVVSLRRNEWSICSGIRTPTMADYPMVHS